MTSDTDTIKRWKDMLHFVSTNPHSSFYTERFARADFEPGRDFHTEADISKIPLLAKSELLEAGEDKLCFVPQEKVEIVLATSGTTSGKPLILFHATHPEISEAYTRHDERTLILFNPLRAGHLLQRILLGNGFGIMGDIHNIPASFEIASRLRINNILTTPTLAVLMKKYLDAYPKLLKSVGCIRLGGEVVTPQKKQLLHELYPGIEINIRYASAEAGRIAQQCTHLAQPNNDDYVSYHPNTGKYVLEIIDPATGTLVKNGTRGELVVTNFTNIGTPLIRYRTGDLAQLVDTMCPCGSDGPLLQVFGRVAQDSLRAGGFELRRDMLETPLMNLRELVQSDFEAHVYEEYADGKTALKVVLHLALQDGVFDSPLTRDRIMSEFMRNWRVSPTLMLEHAIINKHFKPLELQFVDFPRGAKSVARMVLH